MISRIGFAGNLPLQKGTLVGIRIKVDPAEQAKNPGDMGLQELDPKATYIVVDSPSPDIEKGFDEISFYEKNSDPTKPLCGPKRYFDVVT
jgi:hypothetical protein